MDYSAADLMIKSNNEARKVAYKRFTLEKRSILGEGWKIQLPSVFSKKLEENGGLNHS